MVIDSTPVRLLTPIQEMAEERISIQKVDQTISRISLVPGSTSEVVVLSVNSADESLLRYIEHLAQENQN